MHLPEARGRASEAVFRLIDGQAAEATTEAAVTVATKTVTDAVAGTADILRDDDLQVALFVLYELHYRGVDGVDERWEWHPGLLGVRGIIEDAFEARLREVVPVPERPRPTRREVADALFALTEADDG